MTNLPEALRLAEQLEDPVNAKLHLAPYIAAELRRLHEQNQELLEFARLVNRCFTSGNATAKPIVQFDKDSEQLNVQSLAEIAFNLVAKATLQEKLINLAVGEAATVANIEFKRVDDGVDVDGDFVSLDALGETLDVLFAYEERDCEE